MAIDFMVPGSLDQLTGGYLFDRHIVDGNPCIPAEL